MELALSLAQKILKRPLPERVTGFDTMKKLLHLANDRQKKFTF